MTTDQSIFASPEAFHSHLRQLNNEGTVLHESNGHVETRNDTPQEKVVSNQANIQNEGHDSTGGDEQEGAERSTGSRRGDSDIEQTTSQGDEKALQHDNSQEETYSNEETSSHLIPKSRLKQESERRKAIEKELQAEREARIKYEAHLELLAKQGQINTQEPRAPEVDPLDRDAHSYYMKRIEELEKKLDTTTQYTQQIQQTSYLTNMVQNQQAQFEKKHTDFNEALEYVKSVEYEQAEMFLNDPSQIDSYVTEKLRNVVLGSLNKGQNSAETIYNMAKRYGYNAPKPKTETGPNLNAINKNMQKSVSLQGVNNNAAMNNKGVVDIKSALKNRKDSYSGVDSNAFHELLKRQQESMNY